MSMLCPIISLSLEQHNDESMREIRRGQIVPARWFVATLKRQERARQEQLMLAREGSNITGGSAARQVDKFFLFFVRSNNGQYPLFFDVRYLRARA